MCSFDLVPDVRLQNQQKGMDSTIRWASRPQASMRLRSYFRRSASGTAGS